MSGIGRRSHIFRSLLIVILNIALVSQGLIVFGASDVAGESRTSTRSTESARGKSKESSKKKKRTRRRQRTPTVSAPWIIAGPLISGQETTKSELQDSQTTAVLQSRRITADTTAVINFSRLADRKSKKPTVAGWVDEHGVPAPLTIDDSAGAPTQSGKDAGSATAAEPIPGPLVSSPSPSANFLALEDGAQVGTGIFTIPPDTMGAVGLDKMFVTLNNNYRIQDKPTGAALSSVSINTFWAASGATGVFDPRVQYDPYNNRWILSAVSNAQTANSSVLVAVSDTSDPQGTYTLFRIIVGCAAGAMGCNAQGEWADFPMLGFNKNWVAIGWNQFTINNSAFVGGKMLVLDYPTLRAGAASGTQFTNPSAATGFCMHPVTTFSATEETLYVPTHQQSAGALYRLHNITGTSAAPVFTLDATARVRPGGGWTQPGGDNLPQQCVPGIGAPGHTCPASPRGLEAADAFIRSNAVFRNGRVWYAQSIALPAGGLTVASRFAAQWTALNADGVFSDGGRVEDATAQIFNGGKHYSYPSIAVNKSDDVLLGFSEFESDDYVDAGYTFRLGADAAGTMRDPVVYKEGEDYYQKTFSGTRNRWGDYSHTVVDPTNDRDLWTIQEYSQLRQGATGQGSNDSRWSTWWAKVVTPAAAGDLLISEFRLRGPNGANDEFVEVYNNSDVPHTITTVDGSMGYSIAASDGVVRFIIPNGTVIPARGHYLGINSVGYSLASYPSGDGTTAMGDATYFTDIPDNAGIALFSTSIPGNFALATRIDAVGASSEANTLYREGTGYAPLSPFSIEQSFVRSLCPGNTAIFGSAIGCAQGSGGLPKDSNANQNDFIFVDTNGTSAGAGQRLGAPGPENLSSPIQNNAGLSSSLLDATTGAASSPNRVRDLTSDPPNNSLFGTLSLRRRFTNTTGSPITRLRYRIVDLTTFPAPSGIADLRPRSSGPVVVSGVNDAATCSPLPNPCTVTVQGTTLEQPPSQTNGGGFNSSLSAGTITLATPLAPGASVNIQWLLGIQQTGSFRYYVNVEAITSMSF